MKKILLFGATGMAGHMIYYHLKNTNKYEISNVTYRTKLTEDSIIADVKDLCVIEETINRVQPDIILNCIGVLIKGSKEHPDNAIYVNSYFPHLLKRLSDKINAKLIHISTDCVFSGEKGNYSENDFCDANDIYGKSKALGEIINKKDLTIRTSIIGPELKSNGEGLFHWFMSQKGEVNGYKNVIWSGVTTLELAKAIEVAINKQLTGIIQLSNGTGISKYDLLNLIKNIWQKKDTIIIPHYEKKANKLMKKSEKFEYIVPTYQDMLTEQNKWMKKHNNLYNQYMV